MYYIKLNITLSHFQKWEEESLWIADVLKDALISIGFDSFVDNEKGFEAYCSEENYCLDKVKQIAQENLVVIRFWLMTMKKSEMVGTWVQLSMQMKTLWKSWLTYS